MKIIYTGGGTMGSVSPLIAIHQRLSAFAISNQNATADRLQVNKKNNIINNYKALWLGTRNGPEKEIIEKEGIEFKNIAAGKFRRYFDLNNILDLFKILIAFWQSFFILIFFRPNIILSAGGFVSVPVVLVAWILGIPVLIHQQDIRPGLANKLMAPAAARITVALDISLKDFSSRKTILVGNPVRIISNFQFPISKKISNFKFQNQLPVILVMGGGTGALAINNLILNNLNKLTKFCNVIHITGKNKNNKIINNNNNYKSFEFLGDQIFDVLNLADIVVSRAGLSSLTELAYFKKPTIIIPIPNSHQEDNAEYFADKNACIYLKQDDLDKNIFISNIKNLIDSKEIKKQLAENIHKIFIDYSGEKIIKEICKIQKS